MSQKQIRIWAENLASMDSDERLPLSRLKLNSHIHGGLRLEIGGRLVPYLGYFGPDDVCLGQWLEELWLAAKAFETSEHGQYTFDEGEQGQPAFVFERSGHRAFFSITTSEISEAEGDPDWQRIEFSPVEFLAEHLRFRQSLFATLKAAAPATAEQWIQRHDLKKLRRLT
jgi:hypothetical protein